MAYKLYTDALSGLHLLLDVNPVGSVPSTLAEGYWSTDGGTLSSPHEGDYRQHFDDTGTLVLDRYINSTWVLVSRFGSLETTKFKFLDATGALTHIVDSNSELQHVAVSADGVGTIINNSKGRIALINNGDMLDVFPIGSIYTEDTQLLDDETLVTDIIEFDKITDFSHVFLGIKFSILESDVHFRAEAYNSSGVLISESSPLLDFVTKSNTSIVLNSGENNITFPLEFQLRIGETISYKMHFSEPVTLQGHSFNGVFLPKNQKVIQRLQENKVLSVENVDSVKGTVVTSIGEDGRAEWAVPNISVGITGPMPAITDNGNGTINVAACKAILHKDALFEDPLVKYDIPAVTNLTLTDNNTNYVTIAYNGGIPSYQSTTAVAGINESNTIPAYTVTRRGLELGIIPWNSQGDGLVNKLHQRLVKTHRFEIEECGGALISEYGTKNIHVTPATIWYGSSKAVTAEFNSHVTPILLVHHTAGVWVETLYSMYENLRYDDGTNLQNLLPNKYTVNWMYLRVNDGSTQLYSVLGDSYGTAAVAESSKIPANLPGYLRSACVLIGRIIVEQNTTPIVSVQSAFETTFVGVGSPSDRIVDANETDMVVVENGTIVNKIGANDVLTVSPTGLIPPRATTAERLSYGGVANGTILYDTDLSLTLQFIVSAWVQL